MPRIQTPRLRLIPATIATLNAELGGRHELARALEVDVPPSWPPELYDEAAVRWSINALETRFLTPDWGLYYVAEILEPQHARPRLAGVVGFKGPPDPEGTVEIGYGILAERRRLGFAREAVDGLLGWAFARESVTRVIAHTLTELTPSIRVLESAGFAFVGLGHDESEPDAIQYELRRDAYERSDVRRAPFSVTANDRG
ncbi:MAG: GNAT family N-acetyltransferase [Gemmatimonadaceae bacterium]